MNHRFTSLFAGIMLFLLFSATTGVLFAQASTSASDGEYDIRTGLMVNGYSGDSITNNSSTNNPITVLFQPQLLPISRGMLSMLYFKLTPEGVKQDWHSIFARRYSDEPFVRVLPKGQIATIAHVNHTNYCALSIHQQTGALADRLIVVACIDNLVKGASGQALQNMNLMFGFDEREGLG